MLSADNGNTDRGKAHAVADDDLVLPFRTVRSDVIGRLVRLGPLVHTVLSRHAYPEPVSHALGEALALTAMLGSALKTGAKLILQTKTDGSLDFLVADFEEPGKVRGYANFDKADAALAGTKGRGDQGALLGTGHLAMTIDPGGGKDRHQGIVGLDRVPLLAAAHEYFRQSEQLPTFIRLAVARHYGPAEGGGPRTWHWRAGGLMIQQLPREGGGRRLQGEAHDQGLEKEGDENWNRARHLAATVEDHELTDPMLAPERLLYRLFHEEGVRVVPATGLAEACRCSRERVGFYLQRFGAQELADLREPDGSLTVTCEFCSRQYRFAPDEVV
ncbi:MAG: Hsp33 family molecular chaperone [Hyphomicrobiaceae bacterium]|nr:Hsp33 family molecular chaperone [Hyphomicrobiaceae bacterium]